MKRTTELCTYLKTFLFEPSLFKSKQDVLIELKCIHYYSDDDGDDYINGLINGWNDGIVRVEIKLRRGEIPSVSWFVFKT